MKLDPEESQRPKPSANAKPLPEHLKENDASLDISNRTDGVPEIGDPFHDPNAAQKWAEFHTAPEVLQKVAKVDLDKEHRLWFYLGKTSTEARPQYTENLAKPQHNPKSNFLDTVRPPPPIMPTFQHRSYPASYPLKPAPVSIPPRTPVQQNIKPYQYKPKESMMSTFRSPMYSPDTRKNPNSPVAHQPNVVYDHRASGPQHSHSAYSTVPYHHYRTSQGPQSVQGYVPYAPPQSYSSAGWKPQASTSATLPEGVGQYAQSAKGNHPLPPYPYHSAGTSAYSYPRGQGPMSPSPYSVPASQPPASQSQLSSRNGATISNLLSNPAGSSKPPMYATAHSSSVDSSPQSPTSQAEYLAYVTKYPYLKNAFLRRAKTYISPYSPNGGFTPEWMPKPAGSASSTGAASPMQPSFGPPQGLGLKLPGGPPSKPSTPMPRPTPQFQSADAFQQDLAKAPPAPTGAPKWEHMFKQLATATPAGSNATASTPAAQPAPTAQAPSVPQEASKGATPATAADSAKSNTPPLPPPKEPQRPIPSPLSDAPKSPKRPDVSPISDDGKPTEKAPPPLLPPIHTGETWRYT